MSRKLQSWLEVKNRYLPGRVDLERPAVTAQERLRARAEGVEPVEDGRDEIAADRAPRSPGPGGPTARLLRSHGFQRRVSSSRPAELVQGGDFSSAGGTAVVDPVVFLPRTVWKATRQKSPGPTCRTRKGTGLVVAVVHGQVLPVGPEFPLGQKLGHHDGGMAGGRQGTVLSKVNLPPSHTSWAASRVLCRPAQYMARSGQGTGRQQRIAWRRVVQPWLLSPGVGTAALCVGATPCRHRSFRRRSAFRRDSPECRRLWGILVSPDCQGRFPPGVRPGTIRCAIWHTRAHRKESGFLVVAGHPAGKGFKPGPTPGGTTGLGRFGTGLAYPHSRW